MSCLTWGNSTNSSRALPRICRRADISVFPARRWTMRGLPAVHSWSEIISVSHMHNPMCGRCSTTTKWTVFVAMILSFAVNKERQCQGISISRGAVDIHVVEYASSKFGPDNRSVFQADFITTSIHESSIIYLMRSMYITGVGSSLKCDLQAITMSYPKQGTRHGTHLRAY